MTEFGGSSHSERSSGYQSGSSVYRSSSGDSSSSSSGSSSSSSGSSSLLTGSSTSNRAEANFDGTGSTFDSGFNNLGHISNSGSSDLYGENDGYLNSLASEGEIIRKKNQSSNQFESEYISQSTTPFYSQYESQTTHPFYVERPIDSGLGPDTTNINPTGHEIEIGSSPTGTEYTGYPGPYNDFGIKGEPGRDGLDGQTGIQGPPGHVFMIPLSQGGGNEKGPDTQSDALRQMLSQHMVCFVF